MGLEAPTERARSPRSALHCVQPFPVRMLSPGTDVRVSWPGRGPPVTTVLAQTTRQLPDAAQLWARPPSVLLPKLAPTLSPPSARPLPTCLDSSSSIRSGAGPGWSRGAQAWEWLLAPTPDTQAEAGVSACKGAGHGRWDGSSHAQTLPQAGAEWLSAISLTHYSAGHHGASGPHWSHQAQGAGGGGS